MERQLIVTWDGKQMQQKHQKANTHEDATANQTGTPNEPMVCTSAKFTTYASSLAFGFAH